MRFSCSLLRRIGIPVAVGAMVVVSAVVPVRAQMHSAIAGKVTTNAANAFVSKINGENCAQFAASMSKMKGGGSSGSSMSSKLKANPQLRSQFVNIVAGPLLNKMISCDMLPGM